VDVPNAQGIEDATRTVKILSVGDLALRQRQVCIYIHIGIRNESPLVPCPFSFIGYIFFWCSSQNNRRLVSQGNMRHGVYLVPGEARFPGDGVISPLLIVPEAISAP